MPTTAHDLMADTKAMADALRRWGTGVGDRARWLVNDPVGFMGSAVQDVVPSPEEANKGFRDWRTGNYQSPEAQKVLGLGMFGLTTQKASGLAKALKRQLDTLTLYRAQGNAVYPTGRYFSPEKATAMAYQKNPGFGGGHLIELKIPADSARIADLSEALGKIDDEIIKQKIRDARGIGGYASHDFDLLHDAKIKEALSKNHDWVRFEDNYPFQGQTYAYLKDVADLDQWAANPTAANAARSAALNSMVNKLSTSAADAVVKHGRGRKLIYFDAPRLGRKAGWHLAANAEPYEGRQILYSGATPEAVMEQYAKTISPGAHLTAQDLKKLVELFR